MKKKQKMFPSAPPRDSRVSNSSVETNLISKNITTRTLRSLYAVVGTLQAQGIELNGQSLTVTSWLELPILMGTVVEPLASRYVTPTSVTINSDGSITWENISLGDNSPRVLRFVASSQGETMPLTVSVNGSVVYTNASFPTVNTRVETESWIPSGDDTIKFQVGTGGRYVDIFPPLIVNE